MADAVPARIIDRLLASDEPSIRWKLRVRVLGEDPGSRPIRRLREEIRRSPTTRRLLDGLAALRPQTYAKWRGGHWVMLALADLGYPPEAPELLPVREGVLETWLAPWFLQGRAVTASSPPQKRAGVPVIAGRHRRCASQHGGALLAIVRLGLADDRAAELTSLLMRWQWPDGGWNCDLRPAAASSSVHETLLPMRALAAYSRISDDPAARAAAARAAEALLGRRLVFSRRTGRPVHPTWLKLHYPAYWHYDLLSALKGISEADLIADARCTAGLDLLQAKQLPDGGWPVQARYYRSAGLARDDNEFVDWGVPDSQRMNEWVTADALAVLAAAGRL